MFFLLNNIGTFFEIETTRKYPLRRYILGALTHTTAWDQSSYSRMHFFSSASPCLMYQECIFFTLNTYQVTFVCEILDTRIDKQTD